MRLQTRVLVCIVLLAVTAVAATIPPGTRVTVRLNESVNSGSNSVGDIVDGTLTSDVVVNGKTVARAGNSARAKVTHVKPSGRLKTPGEITLRLTSVNGIPVSSAPIFRKGESHTKSNATKIGGGAAAGALIGALAGGGKGAAIGAGVGAGAGTGVAMATGKKEAGFSAELALSFTIR
jgi:hypothetical protein